MTTTRTGRADRCPRCDQIVYITADYDFIVTSRAVLHPWCYHAQQLDQEWLQKRQPETVLLGDER